MEKRLYSVGDMLNMFPRSRTQLYRDMASGLLPFAQVGNRRYFEPEGVERYVEALKTERHGLDDLLELVDAGGQIDVTRIPDGCSVSLQVLKRAVADRTAVA